jgi:hypothetical protein
MERSYRTSNAVFAYAFLLLLTALLLGLEAVQRLRSGAVPTGLLVGLLALAWLASAAFLLLRWGRLRIRIRSDAIEISGDGLERHFGWDNIERVREFRGPAYQLSLRGILPGPYLPHGLLRGETVLVLDVHPATRLVFRQALIDSYGAFRQEVVRSVGRDTEVDLHGRWWHLDDPPRGLPPPPQDDAVDTDEIPDFRRADLFRRRPLPSQKGRAGGGVFRRQR